MNLAKNKIKDYINENNLQDSCISEMVLRQCYPIKPERKYVGKDENNNIIFFEETSGSLQRRHYGKSDKATSFNLVYSDGIKSYKITKDYLEAIHIDFNDGYDLEVLNNFVMNKTKRFNPLSMVKRDKYCLYLSEEEIIMVRDFIKRIRELKDENN